MKKLFYLLLLLSLSFSTPAFAQEPLEFIAPRYLLVLTRDMITYSLDTQTVRYVKDPYREELLVEAWIKSTEIDAVNARYQRYYFRQKERQLQLMATGEYDGQTAVPVDLSVRVYDVGRWQEVAPESLQELWYNAVLKYADANAEALKKKWKQTK